MSDARTDIAEGMRFLTGGMGTGENAREERARVQRIASEADEAFRRMAGVRRGVTVFGSARQRPVEAWGEIGREVGAALASAGFTVITGGGPGLMEAANAGARRHGGASIGLTIQLPDQEPANAFLTLSIPFHYFFLRKLALIKYSCAFVLLPGGFGTLDELFEALNLRRTHRLHHFPIILVGSAYWRGLVEWLRETAVGAGTLTDEDVNALLVTDRAADVALEVQRCHRELCKSLGIAD